MGQAKLRGTFEQRKEAARQVENKKLTNLPVPTPVPALVSISASIDNLNRNLRPGINLSARQIMLIAASLGLGTIK